MCVRGWAESESVVQLRDKAVFGIVAVSVAVGAAISVVAVLAHQSTVYPRSAAKAAESSQVEARRRASALFLSDGEGGETQHLIAARHRHGRRRREEYGFSTYRRGELDLSADLQLDTGYCFLHQLTVAEIANGGPQRLEIDSRGLPDSDLIGLSTVCLRC